MHEAPGLDARQRAAAAIVAASTFALLQTSDGSSPDGDSSRSDVASRFSDDHPAIRGCRERLEGGKIVPDRTVDTTIGPMAFIRLPDAYRDQASRPDSEIKPYPPVGMPTMKVIGVLRAGARVRLVVPRRQRRWMKVVYDYPDHKGGYAIALQACNRLRSPRARRRECGWRPDLACRWRYTQFSGGFGLDFAKALRRGVCAQLVVRVKGDSEPLRDFLFDPTPGVCRGGKPATGGARSAPSDGRTANTTGRSELIKSTPAPCGVGERPDYFVPGPARSPLALLGCARLGVSAKPVEFSGNFARIDGESHLCINPAYRRHGQSAFFVPGICRLDPPPSRFAAQRRQGVRGYAFVIWGTAKASTSEVVARFSAGTARAAVLKVRRKLARRFDKPPVNLFVLELPLRAACAPVTVSEDRSDAIERISSRPKLCRRA